jgi:hypothetical protein
LKFFLVIGCLVDVTDADEVIDAARGGGYEVDRIDAD